jgi:hypothetical protein
MSNLDVRLAQLESEFQNEKKHHDRTYRRFVKALDFYRKLERRVAALEASQGVSIVPEKSVVDQLSRSLEDATSEFLSMNEPDHALAEETLSKEWDRIEFAPLREEESRRQFFNYLSEIVCETELAFSRELKTLRNENARLRVEIKELHVILKIIKLSLEIGSPPIALNTLGKLAPAEPAYAK